MGRLAGWIGIAGGVAWLSLAWIPAECSPVTGASEVFCNRLWTAPLVAMCIASLVWLRSVWGRSGRTARIGLTVVTLGYGLMVVGNGGEYWLAYEWPHEGPDGWLRGLLWLTALAGWLAALLGSTLVGVAAIRGRLAPPWMGAVLALAIPLTVALGALGYPAAMLGIVGSIVGLLSIATAAGDPSARPTRTAAVA